MLPSPFIHSIPFARCRAFIHSAVCTSKTTTMMIADDIEYFATKHSIPVFKGIFPFSRVSDTRWNIGWKCYKRFCDTMKFDNKSVQFSWESSNSRKILSSIIEHRRLQKISMWTLSKFSSCETGKRGLNLVKNNFSPRLTLFCQYRRPDDGRIYICKKCITREFCVLCKELKREILRDEFLLSEQKRIHDVLTV